MNVKNKIVKAYRKLLRAEHQLLSLDANERSITHHLAIYIQQEFPDFNVDCEYNRMGDVTKRLIGFNRQIEACETDGVTVYPDIIVHLRGTNVNFVVIEVKKINRDQHVSNNQCTCDKCKLEFYKKEFGYQNAFYIRFPILGEVEQMTSSKIEDYIEEIN